MKNLPVNTRAAALVLFAFAAYNCGDAVLKHTFSFYSFAEAALYCVLPYGLYVIAMAPKLGGLRAITQTKKKKLHAIRCSFGTCCFLCMVYAFDNITFAEAYTLFMSAPFWIAIMSIFFFAEKVGWHRWSAIAAGFIGVLVVLRPGLIPMEPASIAAVVAAFFFTIFVVYTRKLGDDEPMINMVLFPILSDMLFLIPIILFMGNWQPPALEHAPFFALAGLFYLGGTYWSSKGYASGDSSLLAPIQYSQILWGILLGLIFFNEIPDIWTLAGAVIIVSSGLYIIHREHKHVSAT